MVLENQFQDFDTAENEPSRVSEKFEYGRGGGASNGSARERTARSTSTLSAPPSLSRFLGPLRGLACSQILGWLGSEHAATFGNSCPKTNAQKPILERRNTRHIFCDGTNVRNKFLGEGNSDTGRPDTAELVRVSLRHWIT